MCMYTELYNPESQVITADTSLLWSFSFTNHQPLMTTGFPVNYRWRAYISPKSPKGWLKKSLFVYFFDKIQLQSNKVCYKVSKTFRGLSRTTFVFKDFQGLWICTFLIQALCRLTRTRGYPDQDNVYVCKLYPRTLGCYTNVELLLLLLLLLTGLWHIHQHNISKFCRASWKQFLCQSWASCMFY